jgi:AP-3 complex subunit sigma
MISGFFVINENGDIRFARAYAEIPQETWNRLAHEVFRLVSTRTPNLCNMFPGDGITSYEFKRKVSIVYRAYATLVVNTIVDECENALSIFDIIHSFVQVLNGCFRDVSEVQLAFNPDKALQALDSMINGGLIFETQNEIALTRLAEENAADKTFGIKLNFPPGH